MTVAFAPLVSRDRDQTVVWLEGEHDIATVLELSSTLNRAISIGDADVIVDLSGVTFLGATALNALLRGRNVLRNQSRRLSIRAPSASAQRLLVLCGLTDLVEPD